MRYYPDSHIREKAKLVLNVKRELDHATGVDTSDLVD